jgi:hypothetical protein
VKLSEHIVNKIRKSMVRVRLCSMRQEECLTVN